MLASYEHLLIIVPLSVISLYYNNTVKENKSDTELIYLGKEHYCETFIKQSF